MALPPPTSTADSDPGGDSYGAVILAERDVDPTTVIDVLRGIRFSGWVAPPRDGWVVVLGDPGDGVVADGHSGVIEVGAQLAARSDGAAIAVRVRKDRQLGIAAWQRGEEVGRYCSDPSQEPGADKDVLDQPVGAEAGETLAELWDRPDAAADLAELLDEQLDPDSVFESERLREVLRTLGLPTWIVAAGSLPHDIPTGPRAEELLRLRAGTTGLAGRGMSSLVRAARRRQVAPWVIADPPRSAGGGFEEWML